MPGATSPIVGVSLLVSLTANSVSSATDGNAHSNKNSKDAAYHSGTNVTSTLSQCIPISTVHVGKYNKTLHFEQNRRPASANDAIYHWLDESRRGNKSGGVFKGSNDSIHSLDTFKTVGDGNFNPDDNHYSSSNHLLFRPPRDTLKVGVDIKDGKVANSDGQNQAYVNSDYQKHIRDAVYGRPQSSEERKRTVRKSETSVKYVSRRITKSLQRGNDNEDDEDAGATEENRSFSQNSYNNYDKNDCKTDQFYAPSIAPTRCVDTLLMAPAIAAPVVSRVVAQHCLPSWEQKPCMNMKRSEADCKY